jgi:general secretion pathway protein J
MKTRSSGFTLLELALALGAGAIILVAIYGVFSRAIHLRNDALERTRVLRVQAHALSVLRNDLRGARISGGSLASVLTSSAQSQSGGFPGYLKFTTTTARDSAKDDDVPNADVQQVEYYLTTDPDSKDSRAGMLVRAVDGNLLAPVRTNAPEEPLLTGIESMEISFYDGSDWKESWEASQDDPTLPQAVRVRLQPVTANVGDPKPPFIEVLVPWTTQTSMGSSSTTPTTPDEGNPPQ